MKRFFLIGLFFVLLFLLCSPVDAQERCGRWVDVELIDILDCFNIGHKIIAFLCTDSSNVPDSVWVPEKCDDARMITETMAWNLNEPDTACWHWEEYWEPQNEVHPCIQNGNFSFYEDTLSWIYKRRKVYEPCEKERR